MDEVFFYLWKRFCSKMKGEKTEESSGKCWKNQMAQKHPPVHVREKHGLQARVVIPVFIFVV
ncbi:MAG: hypothetical protein C0604_07175 [Clostridiales bacterium]|nr:MAG: hypothetical protein C0604_07175 [Clostridiales bacterium]